MKAFSLVAIAAGLVLVALIGFSVTPATDIPAAELEGWVTPRRKSMRAFNSEVELRSYLKELAERRKLHARRENLQNMKSKAPSVAAESVATLAKSEATPQGESITNVQHAGVDEGGIVKVHGDHLVVLRRGRLFTVAIGDDSLRPISAIDAYAPDINPSGTWYDEMLIAEDAIAVIGYSYERGGTEIGLFNIGTTGRLSYQATYHLRSNDYYSSRNYASRLMGNKLVFYTPFYLAPDAEDPFQNFPAVRKWHKGAIDSEFSRITPATRVYKPEYMINPNYGLALHTVTVCDLASGGFACKATGVVGPASRAFYVSPESVYVWMSDWSNEGKKPVTRSFVYRMPLDGSAPSALRVSGSPVDQFSFLESNDKQLNVLVRSNGAGDGMWNAEATSGDVALLRVPVSSFSDGSETAPASSYRPLPKPAGYTFQNRFVSNYLLYGSGSGWDEPNETTKGTLYAANLDGSDAHTLELSHGVDRIEAMGDDAVIVGTDGRNLNFTAVRLGDVPQVADVFTRKGASQGELRSHGFFYKPDGGDSGTIGLPITVPGRPGYRHLFEGSAAILFLRNDALHFESLGELGARSEKAIDDRCRASCVDWYGNARPLFLRGRVFALLGYEIVEGTFDEGRVRERRRVSYAPGRAA